MKKNTTVNMRLVSLLSVCLGSVLFMASCSAGQGKGLVACWKFEEGKGDQLLDTSGHGNHGEIHGATWVTGRVGGGLRFDGVDDHVKVPKSASLNSISKKITLMCWIKTPLTGRYTILERWPCGQGSNQRCLELDVDSEEKQVHFALSPTGVTGTWHRFVNIIPVNKWVHIAATFDGESMRIFVNGQADPSPAVLENPRIHPSTTDLYVGAWKAGDKLGGFFKGSMDEIKVYSRALTHEEILQNYKAGSPTGTISGRITDEKGEPIEGAKVSAGPFLDTTNRQGKYEISVPAGLYDVKANIKGYRIGAGPDMEVKEGQAAKADIKLIKDGTSPVISELKVEDVDGVNATIVWKTNEACSGGIKYGTSSRKYDKTLKNPSRVKTHRLNLTGLASGTKYCFVVESTDEAQNATVTEVRTFSTLKVEHPRLIFRKSDLPALRRRAAKTPWKEMKVDAIAYIKSHTYKYDPSKQDDRYIRNRYSSMAGIASAGALAYIVDPANKTYYKGKIVNALSDWDKLFVDARDWSGNNGQYWLNYDWCSAYAHSVLALDVICADLPASRRADLEAKLGRVADWYYAHRTTGNYSHSAYGYWALYRNDRRRIDSAKTGWWQGVMDTMTPCGVYDIGPGYASAGVSYRVTKWDFHHLLGSAGEKNKFYSNRTLIGFYEWIYGASYSPFRKFISFGDSNPTRDESPGVTTYCASRFSKKAGGNAAWFINGQVPPGRLMFYVLADWPPPKPKKPLSHVWPDGCAAFWEDNPSEKSLMGALWSNTIGHNDGHAHHETNALHLCAYGENVLRNTGYCYFHKPYAHGSKGPPTAFGNVVLIDGVEHARKDGGGITEAITAPRFDYASGYSKDALPNGKHRRNFCFVHPQDGRVGYWVVFDEVDADKSSSKINVALHPRSNACTTVSDEAEYKWKIGPKGYTFSKRDVFLTIFLGTKPSSVSIKDGLFWAGGPKSPWVGKYIYSTYETDNSGKRNIVTIIFPHDAKHAKAKMTRISGSGYSGVKINLGGFIMDTAIESSGNMTDSPGGVSFKGLSALFRKSNTKAQLRAIPGGREPPRPRHSTFYFVRKGISFDYGVRPRQGFESDKDVTVYVKDKQGRIISPGTNVIFHYPGITGVLLDGKAAPPLGSGDGWVKIAVAQGNHNISFTNKQK